MAANGKYARHEIQASEDERLLKENGDEQEILESDNFAPNESRAGEALSPGHIIQIEKDEMLKLIKAMMEQPSDAGVPSIYKVPERLRKVNESAYSPRIVSIGPIPKNDDHLKEMENNKVTYMHRLFRRTTGDVKAHECVNAMLQLVATTRACYEERFQRDIKNVDFATMMLVDGCFIIELLWASNERRNAQNSDHKNEHGKDPILDKILVLADIKRDLLLLENQIPFVVLQKLFQLTVTKIPNRCLSQFILKFFEREIKNMSVIRNDPYHILNLLLKCYQPCLVEPSDHPIAKYTATELHRAGVSFNAGKVGYLDVEFSTSCWFSWLCGHRTPSEIPKNCTYDPDDRSCCCLFSWLCLLFGRTRFRITPIQIYCETESSLRNLIAFEQCSPDHDHTGFHVTSYAYLMDSLINSEEDVELLEKAGVLQNYLGASEDAKNLFNNICKEIDLGDYSFKKQCKDAQEYCKYYWPKKLASLRANYFYSPWAIVLVIAALILFALTVVQTVYTVRSSSAFLGLGSLLKYMQ